MTRTRPASLLLLLVLGASILGACGDDGDGSSDARPSETESSSTTPSVSASATEPSAEEVDFGKPAAGDRIKGTGYRYRIPTSWVEDTAAARKLDAKIDTAAWEKDGKDGFRNNVAVTQVVAAGGTLDGLEETTTAQLATQAKEVKTLDRILIDDRPLAHHRGVVRAEPVAYTLDQYSSIDDEGRVTVIAFSYPADMTAKKRDAITHAILASWKWTA